MIKYYSWNLASTPTKTYKDYEKWPLRVNKQLFWWFASITLDNNNVLTDLLAFFSLKTLLHTSVSLTSCISSSFYSFEYFDPYDHFAACWVTLTAECLEWKESVRVSSKSSFAEQEMHRLN